VLLVLVLLFFDLIFCKQAQVAAHQKLCDLYLRQYGDYLYSSERNYYEMKGLIEIDLLDPLIITVK
jgi:hypothetical protein